MQTWIPFLGTLAAAIIAFFVNRHMLWLQAKREVYMDVAVQFSKALRAVAMMLNPNVSIEDATKQFTDTVDAPVRAQIIAKARLSSALMRMGLAVSEMQATAARRRLGITNWVAEADAAASTASNARVEIGKILAERDRYLVDGLNDPRRWQALSSNLEFQQQQRDQYCAQEQAAREQVLALILEAGEEFVIRLQDTGPPWSEVIGAMREELGHRFDNQTFLRLHNQIVDAGAANVRALRASLEQEEVSTAD